MVKDIAEPINVTKDYIAKLLQQLVKRQLISSTRGLKGGFYLNENNRNATIIDIVNAIDSEDRLRSCLLSLKECNSPNPCALHLLVFKEEQIIEENLA
jgi:Rrf2 family iron-sulfur cluster assembly transcriptional regulator